MGHSRATCVLSHNLGGVSGRFSRSPKIAFSELDHEMMLPFMSEKETLVLLKVATMKQIPEEMFCYPWPSEPLPVRYSHQASPRQFPLSFSLLLELLIHHPKTFFRPSPNRNLIPWLP